MGRLQFHTGMLSHPTMALFPKVELDDACKDSRFARGFAIHIQYEQLEIEPLIAALEATRCLLPSSEDSLTDALDQTNEQLDDATMNLAADMKHLLQFQLNDYFDEALHTDWTHKPLSRDGTSCFFGDVNCTHDCLHRIASHRIASRPSRVVGEPLTDLVHATAKISRAREFDTPVSVRCFTRPPVNVPRSRGRFDTEHLHRARRLAHEARSWWLARMETTVGGAEIQHAHVLSCTHGMCQTTATTISLLHVG